MRLIGLMLLVAVLVVGYQQLTTPERPMDMAAFRSEQPTLGDVVAPGPRVAEQAVPNITTSSSGVTAVEASGWCIANCAHHRFEELREGPNTAVHMTTGIAATLTVPAGISIDGWNCFQDADAVGPVQWTGCEATFRRS